MAKVSNYPLLSCWAQETSNKISFTKTDFQNGILYKGNIVSNQLNGVSYVLSQILQFQQCSGGLYQANMTYHKGNFVSILHKGYTTPLRVETYRCINDNDGVGITNRPPVNDATVIEESGVPHYTNGVINHTYWQRVDVGSDVEIEPQEFTPDSNANQYITELCRVAEIDYTQGDAPIKELNADLWITTYLGNKSCAVNLKLNGRYIVNKNKTKYNSPRDYFNMPVPNVSIGEVIFNDGVEYSNNYIPAQKISFANALTNKTINENNLYSGTITPYGFNVWVGYTTTNAGTKIWSIFLAFNEADKITMSGSSNIDLSIKNRTDKVNINIQNVIPVRPNGGATNNYEELMSLREYDFPATTAQEIMLHYSRGEVELRNARVINLGSSAESVYRILGRMQGVTSPTLKEHTGRHTRAYGGAAWPTNGSIYAGSKPGDLLEPGLPNVFASNYWGYYGQEGQRLWNNGFLSKLRQPDGNASYWYSNYGYNYGRRANDGTDGTGGANMTYGSGGWARVYWFLDAYLGNPIYKRAKFTSSNPVSIWDNSGGINAAYNDVTSKSISISRYLKAF